MKLSQRHETGRFVNTWIVVNLEYKHDDRWHSIIANEYYVPSDARLFAALAGIGGTPHLFPPRGIPASLSTYVHAHFFTEILPDEAGDHRKNLVHRWCYEQEAESWTEKYGAKIHFLGDRRFVSNPYSHHETYLSLSEIRAACEFTSYDLKIAPREFQLLLEFMISIDANFGHGSSRLVAWFEN